MRRGWEVFRYEVTYQLGRRSTRVYFAIFMLLALLLTAAVLVDARRDGYFFNTPVVTALLTTVAGMFALLITAAVAGDAATRDHTVRMHSLLYTTPLGKAAYLGGRFTGAFAVSAMLLLAVPATLLLATRLPGVDGSLLGPFRAGSYLMSYFALAVPNAFVATSVLFALAVVTRHAIAAYAGGAAVLFATLFSQGFLAGTLGRWELAKLADPLGFTAVLAPGRR